MEKFGLNDTDLTKFTKNLVPQSNYTLITHNKLRIK